MNEQECINCEYARKAGNKTVVACMVLSRWKHGYPPPIKIVEKCPHCGEILKEQISFDEYFSKMEFRYDEEVYEGWAYLGSRPEGKESGLMSNFSVLLSMHNSCENFKERIT